jgi:hypothetical protein
MEPVHAIAATVGFTSMGLLWLALIAGLALARGWMMTSFKHSTMFAIHHTLALLGLTLRSPTTWIRSASASACSESNC